MNNTISPLAENKRLEWIDAARGFAILGIFMVNVPAFNAPFFLYGGEGKYWSSPSDHVTQAIIDIFFQASFYTLFSFLFGFGMQIIVERLREKGLNYKYLLFRRLLVLIGFGLIHAFLIWHGDILLSYGSIGLLLFLFFARSDKTLIVTGSVLLFIPVLLYTLSLYLVKDRLSNIINESAINSSFDNYGNGGFLDIWQQNYADWIYANSPISFVFLIFGLLPLFLLGMFVARKKWLHQVEVHKGILIKLWWITLLIFIVMKAGPYLVGNPVWLQFAQDSIGGTASALFYLLSITLLYQTQTFGELVKPLTYVGRMSLTNYLFQSIISFMFFYGVGFGLYGDISPLGSVLFVLVIYSLQVFASRWWLNKFRYGPIEWVWRSLTYKKKQPLKRNAREVAK